MIRLMKKTAARLAGRARFRVVHTTTAALCCLMATPGLCAESAVNLALPTPEQVAWHDCEIGMFVHFAPNTWLDSEGDNLSLPLEKMQMPDLDTEQWVDAAEAMGAKYIVFVAKHVGGFCMWQTETTDYSVASVAWREGKGDVLADLSASCRKRGIHLGVYLSPYDRKQGSGGGGRCKTPEEQERYDKIYRQQLTEVLSRYGEMFEVWFDGSNVIEVGDILAKYAPRAMVFQGPHATIRWVGNEDGFAPDPNWNSVSLADAKSGVSTSSNGDPNGGAWLPNECDARIRADWFWNTKNVPTLKSVDQLMEMHYHSVGHGGVLLLNQTPDTTGRIPETDVQRGAEFAAEIRKRFGKSIAETSGKGSEVVLTLDAPTVIDHAIAMEDIAFGERVRAYAIDGWIRGDWRELYTGTAIGHKKIDRFPAVRVEKVRLRTTESAAMPLIRKLAVYRAGSEEPVDLAMPTPQQAAWLDKEIGMMLCFGMETYQGGSYDDFSTPLGDFNPEKLDTDQWIQVGKSYGAGFIVLVAKHVGGFCLWPTETTDYCVKSTPWRGGKGDIVKDVAESCRKYGMKFGVYLSPADRKQGAGVGGRCETPEAQERYNKLYRQQMTELLTRYGDVFEFWFDGSCVIEVGDLLAKHAPTAMVFQGPQATIRWVGNEQGIAPYPAWNSVMMKDGKSGVATAQHGTPDGDLWLPNEVDTTFRDGSWFWSPTNHDRIKSLDHLMDTYYKSVGYGQVLLLNQTPDPSGLIPESDVKRAAEFGAEISKRFGKSLAETPGAGEEIVLDLGKPVRIDHVVTMEDIRYGERVRRYAIEGLEGESWRTLCEGTAVGQKKIDRFAPAEVSMVRFRALDSAAKPLIRKLAVYSVGAEAAVLEDSSKESGWVEAGQWAPKDLKADWVTIEIDIAPYCQEARQYEARFEQTGGENPIEIRSAVLALDGIELDGFAVRSDADPRLFQLNLTGIAAQYRLRAVVRGKGGTDSTGRVLVRKKPL